MQLRTYSAQFTHPPRAVHALAKALPRHADVRAAAAAAASPADAEGSFDAGRGKVGQVSLSQPRSSERASSTTASGRPPASSETIKEAQNAAKLFLTGELSRLFETGKLTKEKYAENFSFQDPIVKYSGFRNFQASIAALRRLFKVDFIVHSTAITGDTQITTRWTMELAPRLTPLVQKLVFTGRSFYTFDVLSGGRITAQRDVWDAVQDNNFLSLEGVAHLVAQITSGQTTPRLESPAYIVWKKTKEYEIRRYKPYLAAEVSMPSRAKPASGDGFQDLAGYIFGGNQGRTSMEMTTPVFTTAGQSSEGKMEFPMEEKMGEDPKDLPIPENARVSRTRQEGATVAVGSFSGFPLDFQVTEAERRLRGALLLDSLSPQQGYKLARYNDPFTPPFLRRNEVLIKLEDYELEPAG